MKMKGRFSPEVGQALKMLICAIFRVEMDIQIEANTAAYRCGGKVEKGAGHFERHRGGWRTQHAECAIRRREEKIKSQESN